MRNILTSCNYRFLVPSTDKPPEEIAIELGEIAPSRKGEARDSMQSTDPIILQKRPAEDVDTNKPRRTRGIQVDY
jgi:hypothetical protein